MKEILGLILILGYFSSSSQDVLIFKVRYRPLTGYHNTIEQTSQSTLKYSGPDDFLQKLKTKGIDNPSISTTNSKIETLIRTGKLENGNNFSISIRFIKPRGGGQTVIPEGTIIYGKGSLENMPTLDSISGQGLTDEFKKTLLTTMQSTMSQISFPEKKLKVGEEFSMENPLSIPIAGITLEMVITTTYKLIDIKNNIGSLDISQVYTLKSTIKGYDIKMTGTGKGQLLYDIGNTFYKRYQIDSEMTMTLKNNNIGIFVTSKDGLIKTTTIKKD